MRIGERSTSQIVLTATAVAFAVWCSVSPSRLEAQGTQGQNTICTSTSAGGPDYRVHFTLEGAPSKLAWAGVFVGMNAGMRHASFLSAAAHYFLSRQRNAGADLGALNRTFSSAARFIIDHARQIG